MTYIFTSLIKAHLASIAIGSISILIVLLYGYYYHNSNDIISSIIGRNILNGFISFMLCLTILFPISIKDKEKIQLLSFEELIDRYLPIITLPLAILFCIAFFSESDSYGNYFFSSTLLITFSMSYTCLIVFIKQLKSYNHEITQ